MFNGSAFCAARRDTQEPRDCKNARDHYSNQDPGTGGEKNICGWNVHSDFPLFNRMRIEKARRTISPGFYSGSSPRFVNVVGMYLCFDQTPNASLTGWRCT
jgi:hypothetical protein